MSTTTSLQTPPATPPRRRRRWRAFLLIVVLLLLGLVGFVGYEVYSSRHGWEQAEAQASETDPRWRLLEIEADRKTIPDEENSALYIMALIAKGRKVSVSNLSNYAEVFDKWPPNAVLNGFQIQAIRGELDKIPGPLGEARQLKEKPNGRFPVTYADDFISTRLPSLHDAREVGDWLFHDTYLLAEEGHYDQAVESCQGILNVGRSMGDHPNVLAHLIRIALQDETVTALERVLAQGEVSDERLLTMQTALQREIKESAWLHGVRGERAGIHHLFSNMNSGKPTKEYLRGVTSTPNCSAYKILMAEMFPASMLKYYPEHLRHMTRAVEIAKLPPHEREAPLQRWDADTKASRNPIICTMTPGLLKLHQADCRSQATLRTTYVAMACERYRRNHQRWPASLEELVQDKLLDALPADPLDNQPLRYRRTKEGVVIYSIGIDRTDNEGYVDRLKSHDPGVDIGFRLWDMPLRRQAPR